MAGLDVSAFSPERFADLVTEGYARVTKEHRRPEAVANALRLMAETLMIAQEKNLASLSEENVMQAKDRTCPVYPFD